MKNELSYDKYLYDLTKAQKKKFLPTDVLRRNENFF